jgi:FKBP-type peptidyl-prolyl cis-trans isomerase FkpA/FKBP-type peptidyl-prolyl cis-trans isomerase FklB
MKKFLVLALAVFFAAISCGKAAAPELTTEDQKTLYALGMVVSENLQQFNLTETELEIVKAGITDAYLKRKTKVEMATYGPKLKDLAQARGKAGAEVEKAAGTALVEKAAAEKGAVKSPTGFVIQEITPGTGPSPQATQNVKVHYKGTISDGTVFDSSIERGQPATFQLDQVIPCWTQGLQMMKVGGKSKLTCPADLAYGDRGFPPKIKPGATLTFEVELLEIVK